MTIVFLCSFGDYQLRWRYRKVPLWTKNRTAW